MVVPSPPRIAGPPRPTSPLMVDELDYHTLSNCSSPATPPFAATRNVVGVDKIKAQLTGIGAKTLGPVDLASRAPCPCCARYVVKECDGKLQQPQTQPQELTASPSTDDDTRDASLPGSLDPTSTSYTVQSIAVQGWIHKKGTGNDIFGSRAWKSRWATLGTATVPGVYDDVAVPVLLIYWFPYSETPSNVLVLDPARTVVMPVDRYPTEEKAVQWNTFTFQIVHSGAGGGAGGADDGATTRVFSVPEQERSEWVCALQQSFREYEQRLQKKKRGDAAAAGGRRRVSPDFLRPPLSPKNSM